MFLDQFCSDWKTTAIVQLWSNKQNGSLTPSTAGHTFVPTALPISPSPTPPTPPDYLKNFTDLLPSDIYFSPSTLSIHRREYLLEGGGIGGGARRVGRGSFLAPLDQSDLYLLVGSLYDQVPLAVLPDMALEPTGELLLRLVHERQDDASTSPRSYGWCRQPTIVWGAEETGTTISGLSTLPLFPTGDEADSSDATRPKWLSQDGNIWVLRLPRQFLHDIDLEGQVQSSWEAPRVCLSHGLGCFHPARWPNANPFEPIPSLPPCTSDTDGVPCTPSRFVRATKLSVASGEFSLCTVTSDEHDLVAAAAAELALPLLRSNLRAVGMFRNGTRTHVLRYLQAVEQSAEACITLRSADTDRFAGASDHDDSWAGLYLEGLRAFLDSPGEFFVDWDARELHLYVGDDATKNLGHAMERPYDWSPVRLGVGTNPSPIMDFFLLSNVTFVDITFDGSRSTAIRCTSCSDLVFDHVTVRNTGGVGLQMLNSSHTVITDSLLEWSNEAAAELKSGYLDKFEYGGVQLVRSHVRRSSLVRADAMVDVGGVGTTVRQCLLEETPGRAVNLVSGLSHHLTHLRVDRMSAYSTYYGAIFAEEMWSMVNTTIEHIHFSRIDSSPLTAALHYLQGVPLPGAIRFDLALSGPTVQSCLVSHMPPRSDTPIVTDGARQLNVRANLYVAGGEMSSHAVLAKISAATTVGEVADPLPALLLLPYRAELWATTFPVLGELPTTYSEILDGGFNLPKHVVFEHNYVLNGSTGNATTPQSILLPVDVHSGLSVESGGASLNHNDKLTSAVDAVFVVRPGADLAATVPSDLLEVRSASEWLESVSDEVAPTFIDLPNCGVPDDACVGARQHRRRLGCDVSLREPTTAAPSTVAASGGGTIDVAPAVEADRAEDDGGNRGLALLTIWIIVIVVTLLCAAGVMVFIIVSRRGPQRDFSTDNTMDAMLRARWTRTLHWPGSHRRRHRSKSPARSQRRHSMPPSPRRNNVDKATQSTFTAEPYA